MSELVIEKFEQTLDELKTNDSRHPMKTDLVEAFEITKEVSDILLVVASEVIVPQNHQ